MDIMGRFERPVSGSIPGEPAKFPCLNQLEGVQFPQRAPLN